MFNLRSLFSLLILAGILSLGYYFLFVYNEQSTGASDSQPEPSAIGKEVALINIDHKHIDEPSALTIIDIDIPRVSIVSDTVGATRANAYIDRFINDAENHFREEAARGAQISTSTGGTLNTLNISASIILNTPQIITLRFDETTMLAQIPHPEKFIRYITYDLLESRPIEVNDLFTTGSSTDQLLPLLAAQSTNKSLTNDALLLALDRNDQHALSKDGLLVSVDAGENTLTETRASTELIIPFAVISQYISPTILHAVLTEKENIKMAEPEEPLH